MFKILAIIFMILAPFKWIYVVDNTKCNGCGNCLSSCSQGAISMVAGNAYIDPELCNGCGNCVYYCPRDAIYKEWYTGIEEEETRESTNGIFFSQNPAAGGFITVSGVSSYSEVKVMDRAGRVVLQDNADEQGFLPLDISDMPEGSYLVFSEENVSVLTVI
ncbi:MAG: 4Fe-4S binding protein [Candidatus Sabulitectum sp.]|nr:4Fe-4S binding protein [Candidatus Sabulitectum sp.]